MKTRKLGLNGPEVSAIGLGCMGMSAFYGGADEGQSISVIHRALDLGVTLFDTAEMYGPHTNEMLVGKALKDRRDQAFIATKFGPTRNIQTGEFTGLDGSPENCRRAIEASLQRLRTDHVDLYYLHRVDPTRPIEETVAAMATLVAEGKVGAIGLSEAAGDTIRRAAKVHPIAAVQSEYSIFSRDIEVDVIPACLEVGASLVAYSPLGRGLLTGRFRAEKLNEGDWRSTTPRFQGEAYAANVALAEELEAVATAKSCTPGQIALAWVIGRGEHILALTGTTKLEHLKANLGACNVELSHDERMTLDALAARVMGDRYDTWGMAGING
jgi:aryl-alcohol dehydrogenase-like predicted oxidoreductase